MALRSNLEPKEYLEILLRRKWIIIFSVLVVGCMALAVLITTPPVFMSTTTIMIIPQKVSDAFVHSTASGWMEERLATLGPLVMSRTRLLQVINEYGLFRGTPGQPRVPEDVQVDRMRKRIVLAVDTANDYFSLSFSHEDPTTAMLVTNRLASYFMEEQTKTRERQVTETSQFLDMRMEDAEQKFRDQEEKLRQFKYRYLDELPNQADYLLRGITGFQEQYNKLGEKLRSAEQRKANLEIRDRSLNKSISAIFGDNLKAAPPGKGSETGSDMDPQLAAELAQKQIRLKELSQKYTDKFPGIRQLKSEISQLEELLGYTSDRGPGKAEKNRKPDLDKFYRRLLPLESEEKLFVREEIAKAESEIALLKKDMKAAQENMAKHREKLNNAPMREEQLLAMTREYETQKNIYEEMKRKKAALEMGEAIEERHQKERFQILDPANLPKAPYSPDVKRIFKLAFLAAFAFGFGGAFGVEALDSKIRGAKDFQHFSRLPILATLPVIKGREYSQRMAWRNMAFLGGAVSLFLTLSILFFIYYGKIKQLSPYLGVVR